ncbi:FkbM family methyltransferase [Halorussus salinisoli]|uniref:FkbM family methyltransferase n=1 Tax=Halorussus salinisoli TaxID=2558242 RepID=UPI0010C1F680|nr:FkbM family methyltransferase [Halorussus salinisoli]
MIDLRESLKPYYYFLTDEYRSWEEVDILGEEMYFPPDFNKNSWNIETEKPVMSHLIQHIKIGDVFWDVGANIGLYSVLVSKHLNNDCTIVSFEPYLPIAKRLERVLKRNNIESYIIRRPLGTGDTNSANLAGEFQKVETKTASGLVAKGAPSPDVIKIDVEGMEYSALQGMEALLENNIVSHLYIELHPDVIEKKGHSVNKVTKYVEGFGYNPEILTERGENGKQPFAYFRC